MVKVLTVKQWYRSSLFFAFSISFAVGLALHFIIAVFWLVFNTFTSYPGSVVNFVIIALSFLLGGLLGPGKYRKTRNLVIYLPREDVVYTNSVLVVVFSLKSELTTATLYINEKEIKTLTFSDGIARAILSEELLSTSGIFRMWVQAGKLESQKILVNYYPFKQRNSEHFRKSQNVKARSHKGESFQNKGVTRNDGSTEQSETRHRQIREQILSKQSSNLSLVSLGIVLTGITFLAINFLLSFILSYF